VRTRDDGAHWQREFVPGPQAYPGCGGGNSAVSPCDDSVQGRYNTVGDAFLHVDRDTSRIFWSKTYGYAVCSSLGISPDDGATWKPIPRFGCPGGDYGKIASGPPPAGAPKPAGPFPMTAAAPRTGSSVASAGERGRKATSASTPPTPNSHTRVKVEKYAVSAFEAVAWTNQAKLAAVTATTTTAVEAQRAMTVPSRISSGNPR
jgi:hypothetical protein